LLPEFSQPIQRPRRGDLDTPTAQREGACDPRLALARFLSKEAETLRTDPRFEAEVYTVADLLSIPLPAAVVSDRTCTAIARRCSEMVADGQLRQAVALLAGHRLAIERWIRSRRGAADRL